VGILLTPFIIKSLGDSEYGIYTTIGVLIGTFSLLDFGLNNTIIRFVAKYRAEHDKKGEENFLAITMIIYLFISTIVLIVGYIVYKNLDNYFQNLTKDELEIARKMFIILTLNIAIGLPGGAFTAICLAYEKFVFPKAINIARYILRSVLVIFVLSYGGNSIALVILDTIFNLLIIIFTILFVYNNIKIKIRLHNFNWKFIKVIFKYSVWIFVYGIVAQFQWRLGHIALGSLTTPEVLAVYAVGLMLGGYYGAFSSAITSVFLPRATKMTVEKASPEVLTNEMIKIGRLSFMVLLFILTGFILFGQQFVFLWVGETYEQSWTIALLIMLAYTIPLTQGFTGPLIEAQDRVAFKSLTYLHSLLFGTILGYFAALEYGALGMISGTILGWIIAQNIMNIYYHKVMNLDIIRFFKEIAHKIIPTVFLIIFIGLCINYIPGKNWVNFIVKGTLYFFTFFFLMYSLGMIPYEKSLFKNLLLKLKNR
jgi:O-antigen/teichoic acid export membrane protein